MMSAQSNLSGDEIVTNARPWNAPQIDGRIAARRGARSVAELDAIGKRAYSEAEAAGREAGLAAAQQEINARLRGIDKLASTMQSALQALSRPLAHVDDSVHEQIVRLAVAIARGIVRRELQIDPTQIIGIVRETVALLPASARGIRVVLHPEDAALVRERLATPHADQNWSIAEDPVLTRGDCRVVAEYAQIDARVEARLAEVIAGLLGDERERPRGEVQS